MMSALSKMSETLCSTFQILESIRGTISLFYWTVTPLLLIQIVLLILIYRRCKR